MTHVSDRRRLPRKIGTTLIASAMAVLCFGTSFADDTEVFFGQVDRTRNNQPNVLFVLDTSGSMNWTDAQVGGSATRLERMKEAMTTILNQSDNVNVGLMRFNGVHGGGSVLYPITPIDEEVCEANNCGNELVTSKINSISDDSEERGDGVTMPTGNTLSLRIADPDRKIGLRFTALNIPQGATITSAAISFVSDGDSNGSESITIKVEDTGSSQTFTDDKHNISSRPFNTATNWEPGVWEDDGFYTTSDVSKLVQQVVNRGDWCGGNAINFAFSGATERNIVSYDSAQVDDNNQADTADLAPAKAPVLNVSYDSTSIPVGGGCTVKYAVSAVDASANDAEELINSGRNTATGSGDLEFFVDRGYNQLNGVRFTNVQIPKNARILESTIEFEMDRDANGTSSGQIYGEARNSPGQFKRERNNIANRRKTGASVQWDDLPRLRANAKLVTPSLNPIVSEITRRDGWKSGNSMVFILENRGSSGKRAVESYDGDAGAAPKLIVKYESFIQPSTEQPTYITARDRLLSEIKGMTAQGGTPIVGAYYEAAQYMLGDNVDYGRNRGFSNRDRNGKSRFHRVSHPLSYVGGAVERRSDCTDNNLDAPGCTNERIVGQPRYISPIEASCQTNHIVLLSDGDASLSNASSKVRSKIGKACTPVNDSDELCGTDLAEWLANTDHSSLDKEQTISTYTIGFNTDHPFLKRIAKSGKGRYSTADSAAELAASFQEILAEVNSTDTSFVAPGATVNQFNRLTHRNDIYFALFKPGNRPTWSGNLKKYEVGLDAQGDVTIFDHSTPRANAIDEEKGFFSDTARSDWSKSDDGSRVAAGGAAEVLQKKSEDGTGPEARQMYTFLGNIDNIPTRGYDIRAEGNLVHEANTAFTDADLGISTSDPEVGGLAVNRTNLLKWIRGIDVKDEDGDGDSNEFRQHIGDPMHSRPVILNYENGENDPYTTVFMGTNEGVLHGIDNVDGEEMFSFIPPSLLGNIKDNFTNFAGTDHQYGLDGPMTTWSVDANNNAVVDDNEVAMLYLGMRRGGSNYYAFDVSKRESPKLKWIIKGGEGEFANLGQSWSRMVPTKIFYEGDERDVLIFGGGYDTGNDVDYSIGAVEKTVDDVGNSIFIVDALDGTLIYELGSEDNDNATQKFDDMNYAIPSDIRVLDINGNGFADSLFVGDLGGQVWRFDINLYRETEGEGGTGNLINGDVKPMATLGLPHSDISNNRRFFYEPDVALISDDGQRYLSVSIGSGWRSHPLNTDVDEAFFMLRSNNVYNLPEGHGKKLQNGNYTPLTESDLTNVSGQLDNNIGRYGWMLFFDEPGEKVLGDALTVNNQVIFTTFLPESDVVSCSAAIGSGAVYALRVVDGRPSLDLNDNGSMDIGDRSSVLAHGGVPPEATALIVEGTVTNDKGQTTKIIKPTVLVGPEQPLGDIFSQSLTRRAAWVDAGMTEEGAAQAEIDDF